MELIGTVHGGLKLCSHVTVYLTRETATELLALRDTFVAAKKKHPEMTTISLDDKRLRCLKDVQASVDTTRWAVLPENAKFTVVKAEELWCNILTARIDGIFWSFTSLYTRSQGSTAVLRWKDIEAIANADRPALPHDLLDSPFDHWCAGIVIGGTVKTKHPLAARARCAV